MAQHSDTTQNDAGNIQDGLVALFVSDVHLHPSRAATTRAFERFLTTEAPKARHLFLLGDLFEYWAGDDDIDDPYHRRIVGAIQAVTHAGVDVSWISGNRDFLVGESFSARSGAKLLADPAITTIAGQSMVLTHGDALCIDDIEYQKFRSMVRQSAWQKAFLSKPLAERKAIIAGMRDQSKVGKTSKSADIMDVNMQAVDELFDSARTPIIVHGHTHRPQRHCVSESGEERVRYVLPDWDCENALSRGGWLGLGASGQIHRFSARGELVDFNHP
jgi:UDP-2,3-diacylglucosamine hydrolase